MATIYVCDRCHAKERDRGDLIAVTIPAAFIGEFLKDLELCRRCVTDLRRAAEPLPQEAKA